MSQGRPALLAGCTIVLKPSPENPLDAYIMAEIAESIGLPAGVLNVVAAHRPASEHLIRNPGVDKVAFTGSSAAGKHIASILRRADGPLHHGAGRQVGGHRAG